MVYAILYEFENRDVLPPAEECPPFPLLGRVVYKDPFSAVEAARSFHDFTLYALDLSYARLSIHEIHADWETDTIEVPEAEEEDDWPTDLEPSVSMVQEPTDEGRYLTREARIGKLIKEI